MPTKRTILRRRPKGRFDDETLALFVKYDAIPSQRRAFSDGGRELARRLGLTNEWWTGNSVLDRSERPSRLPPYAAYENWRSCRAVREQLLAAVERRASQPASES